jgi:MFS family permease
MPADDVTTRPARRRAPRVFYGWIVVAAVFGVTFIGFGTAYTFAAFFPWLQAEFHAQRGQISLIFSLAGFLYFGLGVVSGPLADRLGPRGVVAFGMLLIGSGLWLASRATTLWEVYAWYALGVGLGVGFVYVPAVGAVQRWFVAQRGLATGLAVAGIGVGTLVVPLMAAAVIRLSHWRSAYQGLALMAIVIGGGLALLIEHSPQRCGLQPDGVAPTPAAASAASAATGPTIRDALRTGPFWWLYVASLLSSVGLYIPFVHLPAYARDHGISEGISVLLLGLIGVGSVAGRFGMAGLADRFGRRRAMAVMYGGMAIMLFWWASATSAWALSAFAVLFGLGYGGYVALFPALSADYFAGAHSSGIFGFLVTNLALGTLIGPALAGLAFDATHSYVLPIVVSAVFNVVAAICMLRLVDAVSWRARWEARRAHPAALGCLGSAVP